MSVRPGRPLAGDAAVGVLIALVAAAAVIHEHHVFLSIVVVAIGVVVPAAVALVVWRGGGLPARGAARPGRGGVLNAVGHTALGGTAGHRPSGRDNGWASRRSLRPLLSREVPSRRIPLGMIARRTFVAAEERQSVIVVGPSQSGKTTGVVVPAIVNWDGPVLAASVKSDLLGLTIKQRRRRGAVAVYDPTQSTGEGTIGWSPLAVAATWPGARRIAAAMCSVAESDGGMQDARFWYASAEKLLAPLFFAAAIAGASMSDVVRWIDDQEVQEPLLALELAGVGEAVRAARASFGREERQRSSVFATAETVIAAFADPEVALSTGRRSFEPEMLLGPRRELITLYCCAPAREQDRLRPLFTAIVREVLDAAFAASTRAGEPLDPGLLVVLDEAANVAPLAELDAVLATAAGHGIQLVTVWQDIAQIEARYGRRASTIVNNHKAKLIFPGISDPLTLDHVSSLVGERQVSQLSRTVDGDGRSSRTEATSTERLLTAGSIRQLPPGESVLLYGSLPPARMRCLAGVPEASGPALAADPVRGSRVDGRHRLARRLGRSDRGGRAGEPLRPAAAIRRRRAGAAYGREPAE